MFGQRYSTAGQRAPSRSGRGQGECEHQFMYTHCECVWLVMEGQRKHMTAPEETAITQLEPPQDSAHSFHYTFTALSPASVTNIIKHV